MEVVVDHQGPAATQVGIGQQLRQVVLADSQPGGEVERAPLADFALHADIAPHQLRQLLADRQPQPGAAELTGGGGIGLGEALEQPADLFGRQPDAGVAHTELDQHLGVGALEGAHRNAHLPVAGELHGVIHEIQQDLAQPQRIAHQIAWNRAVDIDDQLQTFFPALAADQATGVVQQLLHLERGFLESKLAGLDLGKVQDVVHDAQQVLTGRLHLVDVVPLPGRQLGLEHQVRQADDRVHRSADLVAHVGEETGLGLGGRFGQFEGRADLFQMSLALADVARHRQQPLRLALGIPQRRHHGFEPDLAAVGHRDEFLAGSRLQGRQDGVVPFQDFRDPRRRKKLLAGSPEDLLERKPGAC